MIRKKDLLKQIHSLERDIAVLKSQIYYATHMATDKMESRNGSRVYIRQSINDTVRMILNHLNLTIDYTVREEKFELKFKEEEHNNEQTT